VTKRIRLGKSNVEGRDEKGIKKTVAAFLKMLHPDGPPTTRTFEEYVAYAVESRRRVKEQMNKRKPDDEFAKINLSYFAADGSEVVVFCPESKDAAATQQPTRRGLDGIGLSAVGSTVAVETKSTVGAVDVIPPTPAKEFTAPEPAPLPPVSDGDGAASMPLPAARPSPPTEQHYAIRYGDTGHSYESIMADYLQGASKVVVEDPYVRLPHQIQNFVRFCEMIVSHPTIRHIKLVTNYDDTLQQGEAESKLQDLGQSLLELDIVLEVAFDPNLHDREIQLDNGWVIKIGRGLDFYQKPATWHDIGSNDLTLRRCLETKVDIYRSGG
jgi:ATP-dependent Lon protease